MMKILGVLIFLLYLQIKLCLPKTEDQNNGFCIEYYVEQEAFNETFIHTYDVPELQWCYRQGYCWRSVKKSKINTKIVYHDVPHKRVKCCLGYRNVTVHEHLYHCEPICDPPCIDGHCSTPGNCTCFNGFRHQNSHKCTPYCMPNCINGLCTSPGHCDCNPSYDKVNNSYCEPHCSQNCSNGVCHSPEKCLCNGGYKNNLQNPFICDPICDELCINSTCTGYNECTCWDGYKKLLTATNACNPICKLECIHGECTSPDICSCHEGYTLNNDSLNICEPECFNCTNGFCIEPNNCSCYENYTQNEDGQCEPNCHNCSNGECFEPYECSCNDGYEKNDHDKCVPYCSSCRNGNCTEPNVCTCFEGYQNYLEDCIPVCKYGCYGGMCISPDVCSCEEAMKVEENLCLQLEDNMGNKSENITPHKFKIKFSNELRKIDLSSVSLNVNCSFIKQVTNYSNYKMNDTSLFSVECFNIIINPESGLKLLCMWSGFNNYFRDVYEDLLQTNEYKNFTFDRSKILDMTIFLPTNVTEKEANCHMCPSETETRLLLLSTFNLSFSFCQLNKLQLETGSYGWKGVIMLAFAILATLAILTLAFVLYFRKRMGHNYLVHYSSEEHMDDIPIPMNPQVQ